MTILHQIVRTSLKLSPSTKKAYLADLDLWINFAGPNPSHWTRYRAQEFYESLLERMKPQSAKRVIAALAHASSWWAKKENNPQLHFAVVQTTKDKDFSERHALTPEQAVSLLSTCRANSPIDLRDFAMFVVGLETGMRRMSLAGMTFEGLQKSHDGSYPVALVPVKGAGDDLYPVALSDTTLLALEPWRVWLRRQKISKGPVFRGLLRQIARGGTLTYRMTTFEDPGLSLVSIYKIVTRRAEQAGLVHVHPHLFRNTFISWRMRAGLTPFQIAAITGHKMTSIAGMASMGTYIDPGQLADEARNSTPAWLAELVRNFRVSNR